LDIEETGKEGYTTAFVFFVNVCVNKWLAVSVRAGLAKTAVSYEAFCMLYDDELAVVLTVYCNVC